MRTSIFLHITSCIVFIFSYFPSCHTHTLYWFYFILFIYFYDVLLLFSYLCSPFLCGIQLLFAAEKLYFPTEIISFLPHLPIKLHSGLQHTVSLIRIYCTVAQWLWFSAAKTMQSRFVTLVRGVNGQWNELWHQSINIIFLFQAKSLD